MIWKIHCLTSEFHVKFNLKNPAISHESRNLNRIAKATWAKPNVFYFCEPRSAQIMETLSKSMSMRFLVLCAWVVSSNFLKFQFQFEIWQTFVFCKFVHFQGVFFPSTSCIFVFTIATIFAHYSRQQYRFMHKCKSTLNILSSIANQTAGLPLAKRFCREYLTDFVETACSYRHHGYWIL